MLVLSSTLRSFWLELAWQSINISNAARENASTVQKRAVRMLIISRIPGGRSINKMRIFAQQPRST